MTLAGMAGGGAALMPYYSRHGLRINNRAALKWGSA